MSCFEPHPAEDLLFSTTAGQPIVASPSWRGRSLALNAAGDHESYEHDRQEVCFANLMERWPCP